MEKRKSRDGGLPRKKVMLDRDLSVNPSTVWERRNRMTNFKSRKPGSASPAVAALAVVLAVGCGIHYDYRLEVTETRSWPASGITRITASSENGGMTVEATEDTVITAVITRTCRGKDRADAEDHIGNVVVEDNVGGGVLTIEADMPSNGRGYGASFEIRAPESVYLDLLTSNGGVSVSNMVGGAKVSTSNGGITLADTREYVDLATSNGALNVQVHDGGVSGATSNGNVNCDLVELGADESANLSTSNGSVTLTLPENVSASFSASTSNGTVTITGFSSVIYTVNEPTHKVGRIGGGASEITISTSNGNVTIRPR